MIQYIEESHGIFAISLYKITACESIINHIRSLKVWESAQVREATGDNNYDTVTKPSIRSARVLHPTYAPKIFQEFNGKMNNIIKPLVRHIWRVNLIEHSGTQVIQYKQGGGYIQHQDADNDAQDRYFSVICYLNDDFEGGHTWFPSLNYSTLPQRGKAILFPSKYFHCAEPVLYGEKYVFVSWVLGPVPIKWV